MIPSAGSPLDGAVEVPGGHRAPAGAPPLPGGISVSRLRVYDSTAADGLRGGTPHLHTACTEAYAVVGGAGRVLTVDGDGLHETPLEVGSVVWFTPGTVHRLVNDSGDLEILVLMANAGLPEAGDMVITFPDEVLADPEAYAAAAALPTASATTTGDDAPVRARRDLAARGWADLLSGGPDALAALHRRAVDLVRPRVRGWHDVVAAGPAAALEATIAHLAALDDGESAHLGAARTVAVPPPPEERRHGCCGTLGVLLPPLET